MPPSVVVRREGSVAIATISRPEVLNALDTATIEALADALSEADAADDVRAVVLTGAGERAFSAGADLKEGAGAAPADTSDIGAFGRVVRRTGGKPTIAAVNGLAFGGGFELVLSCDLVVAAERATFGLPEVRVGVMAGGGGVIRVARRVPIAVALELVMTGQPIDAARAYALGLVNKVVPDDRVVDDAVALAGVVAENAPVAVRLSRDLARAARDVGEDEGWRLNAAALGELRATEDFLEGPRAFAEKRKPRWKGR